EYDELQTQSSDVAPTDVVALSHAIEKTDATNKKSILLLAIPNEYLIKFHNVLDAKSLWAAIKSRFGVSREDIIQKFLRSLPLRMDISQIALIMRNNPDIDQTDIDDLYNNLRVYEDEMKRSSSSTSNSQKLGFFFFFFAHQATSPPLNNEDLQQIDQDDLEELDIRQSGRNQGKRSNDDNGKRNATSNEPSSQALVAQDGLGGYDWSNDFDEPVNYALMAISSSSSSSSSDNEVQNCSKQCLESFKTLQKNYDSEREKHSRARLEIQGYELALESLESRILGHEKNELAWGEKYEFQNYELKCRELKIDNLKMELEKVVKERDELKVKIEKWEESSKGLNKLLNSQMSAKDKNGLGYGTQLDEISLDEYAIRKKIIESKTTELNTDTSKSKTSETVDDEDDVSEVNTVNPVKTNETQTVKTQVDKIGQISQKEGIGFKKIKACFVCKSTDHLIKDCDFYAKKSPEPKLKTVVNTGQRVVKPVWDNAKRVNHQKISNKLKYPQARRTFVLSGVLTMIGLVNPVRPNGKRVVHTVSTARPISTS
ncbi:hypothetical protein Tco_1053336, partial [Tanacetum coccineum]